ncbi:T9SS type A sorting domain-containing protein [candidate division KSB1 bacterium]|nr:T9SS type A sorting domain-containing protein [candidate division KSB1 bacterium]
MKKMGLLFMLVLFLMLTGKITDLMAQPKAVITVEAMSPQEIHNLGWTSHPSTGLKVVGKGELVDLSGKESAGDQVTTYAWSLTTVPTGSQAKLDSTDKAWTTFAPDLTGDFVVQLTITTAKGTGSTTVTIVSAEYVGIGIAEEIQKDINQAACSPCHTNTVAEWAQTGHVGLFRRGIDGTASDHYGEACIECHVLGFDESPTAANGGFDDVALQVGWTFPDTLKAGNYQDLITKHPTLGKLASIQCENCHGPASEHKTTFSKDKMAVTLDAGVCSRCHDEAPYHRRGDQWKNSRHAIGIASAATRAECAACHSGYGFIHAIDPNNQLSDKTGFPQVSCQVCHDPHSVGYNAEHQIRKQDAVTLMNGAVIDFGGTGKLCMNCHQGRRDAEEYAKQYSSRFSPHYCNQADMLAGTNAVQFGMYIPSSTHRDVIENGCVTCHMAATPAANQPGRDFVGEHSFAMHWDGGTPTDSTDDVYHVGVCEQCHGDMNTFDDIMARADYDGDGKKESARTELHGMMDKVGRLLPPLGDPSVVVTSAYTPLQLKAAFNYLYVEDDGSEGMHNYQYAINLLKVTYLALMNGVLSPGKIESVTDVPNDQGKQVRVAWNRFGGDGVSDNPIKNYAVWRRVDDKPANASKTGTVYPSLDRVPADLSKLNRDSHVLINSELWDFVSTLPAAGQDHYSTVVPTLFDSTKVAGLHWSVFYVSGHTATPAIFVACAPDSGYSLDNLAPTAPTNLLGTEAPMGISLKWDDPVDQDFKYFAVYRSLTPGINPKTTKPMTTLTETTYTDTDVALGNVYYYALAAVDFSGNQSPLSKEFTLQVTRVTENGGSEVPVNYVLNQNYPNPFNPTTQIVFGLPKAEHVNIVIYNLQGGFVRALATGKSGAGYHTLTWDGRDHHGKLVGAGLFIYYLRTESSVLSKKMIFLK